MPCWHVGPCGEGCDGYQPQAYKNATDEGLVIGLLKVKIAELQEQLRLREERVKTFEDYAHRLSMALAEYIKLCICQNPLPGEEQKDCTKCRLAKGLRDS